MLGAYCAAKSGVILLTQCLATELGPAGHLRQRGVPGHGRHRPDQPERDVRDDAGRGRRRARLHRARDPPRSAADRGRDRRRRSAGCSPTTPPRSPARRSTPAPARRWSERRPRARPTGAAPRPVPTLAAAMHPPRPAHRRETPHVYRLRRALAATAVVLVVFAGAEHGRRRRRRRRRRAGGHDHDGRHDHDHHPAGPRLRRGRRAGHRRPGRRVGDRAGRHRPLTPRRLRAQRPAQHRRRRLPAHRRPCRPLPRALRSRRPAPGGRRERHPAHDPGRLPQLRSSRRTCTSVGSTSSGTRRPAAAWPDPGHSEHQLGTTIDVTTEGETDVDQSWGATPSGQWVATNAHEYGFLLELPAGRLRPHLLRLRALAPAVRGSRAGRRRHRLRSVPPRVPLAAQPRRHHHHDNDDGDTPRRARVAAGGMGAEAPPEPPSARGGSAGPSAGVQRSRRRAGGARAGEPTPITPGCRGSRGCGSRCRSCRSTPPGWPRCTPPRLTDQSSGGATSGSDMSKAWKSPSRQSPMSSTSSTITGLAQAGPASWRSHFTAPVSRSSPMSRPASLVTTMVSPTIPGCAVDAGLLGAPSR